jgi:hypothetical protein
MIRNVAGSLALLALFWAGFAITEAAPYRQPRERPPSEPEPLNFNGTQWFGKTYEGTDWTITFEPGGGITNIESGRTYKVGSWKTTGPNSVYMELNQVYYEFRGTVTGDVLAGDSSNKVGLRWKTTFQRIAPTR